MAAKVKLRMTLGKVDQGLELKLLKVIGDWMFVTYQGNSVGTPGAEKSIEKAAGRK